jgi:soluble lytic murein transglycosylase
MARLEQERGRYHVALRYAKKYVPSYFAQDIHELPRDTWALLFPLPWWDQLKKQATAAKVDPYLVAGLIRQESEFDPRAHSRSNARGLMQLLPSTARIMARKVPDPKARRYQLASLFTPDINLVYGTFYLKQVLDQFGGTAEYALAGYNAGENRVVQWLQNGPFEEPAEFVESIPFTETRDYVQAVLRNAALYRALYSNAK